MSLKNTIIELDKQNSVYLLSIRQREIRQRDGLALQGRQSDKEDKNQSNIIVSVADSGVLPEPNR